MTFGELRFSLSKLLPGTDPDVLDVAINNRVEAIARHLDWKAAETEPLTRFASTDTTVAIPDWVSIPAVMAGVRADLAGDTTQAAIYTDELAAMRRDDCRRRGVTPLQMSTIYTAHRLTRNR